MTSVARILREYFVVPIIQWDYLSDLHRVPEPTNSYSESLGDKNRKTPTHTVPGTVLATLLTPLCHSSSCIMSFLCPLLCPIIWILCYRKRSKPVHSALWTQKANSLIGNCCFSSPWDGKNHFPFLQAVESPCPPGNEKRFPGLYDKINYSFVSFQGWGRVNRGGEMH